MILAQSPFITSGIRIGSPAVTTRGFKEKECEQVANWICDILDDMQNTANIACIRNQALDLCRKFPVYNGDVVMA